jgi:hypothetical protein
MEWFLWASAIGFWWCVLAAVLVVVNVRMRRRGMHRDRYWLAKLAAIELLLATGFMWLGFGAVGVFTAAMAAHSAYLAGRR